MEKKTKKIGKVYKFWLLLLGILSGGCLLYFLLGVLAVKPEHTFYYVWLGLALFSGCLLFLVYWYAVQGKHPPKWVVIPMEILVGAGFFLLILIEAILVQAGKAVPPERADYLIVLGSRVNGTRPSLTLQYRIKAALEYLKKNPATIVIASGGQGVDEDISEAQCIYNELKDGGVEPERIIMESRSTTTRENLLYSGEFLDPEQDRVVITTTDFHVFRALRIAKRCNYKQVWGNGSKSVWWLVPTNYTREFLAVVRELLFNRDRKVK